MKIKPCYSATLGRYLSFEATRRTDSRDLRQLSLELASAGIKFGSVSVHGKMLELSLPVLTFRRAPRGESICSPKTAFEVVERSSGFWVVGGINAEGPFDTAEIANEWIAFNS